MVKTYQLGQYFVSIGQNAKENTELVQKFKNSSAIWFHLKDLTSCHILLYNADTNVPVVLNKELKIKIGELMRENVKYTSKMKIEFIPVRYVKTTNTLGLVELLKKSTVYSI